MGRPVTKEEDGASSSPVASSSLTSSPAAAVGSNEAGIGHEDFLLHQPPPALGTLPTLPVGPLSMDSSSSDGSDLDLECAGLTEAATDSDEDHEEKDEEKDAHHRQTAQPLDDAAFLQDVVYNTQALPPRSNASSSARPAGATRAPLSRAAKRKLAEEDNDVSKVTCTPATRTSYHPAATKGKAAKPKTIKKSKCRQVNADEEAGETTNLNKLPFRCPCCGQTYSMTSRRSIRAHVFACAKDYHPGWESKTHDEIVTLLENMVGRLALRGFIFRKHKKKRSILEIPFVQRWYCPHERNGCPLFYAATSTNSKKRHLARCKHRLGPVVYDPQQMVLRKNEQMLADALFFSNSQLTVAKVKIPATTEPKAKRRKTTPAASADAYAAAPRLTKPRARKATSEEVMEITESVSSSQTVVALVQQQQEEGGQGDERNEEKQDNAVEKEAAGRAKKRSKKAAQAVQMAPLEVTPFQTSPAAAAAWEASVSLLNGPQAFSPVTSAMVTPSLSPMIAPMPGSGSSVRFLPMPAHGVPSLGVPLPAAALHPYPPPIAGVAQAHTIRGMAIQPAPNKGGSSRKRKNSNATVGAAMPEGACAHPADRQSSLPTLMVHSPALTAHSCDQTVAYDMAASPHQSHLSPFGLLPQSHHHLLAPGSGSSASAGFHSLHSTAANTPVMHSLHYPSPPSMGLHHPLLNGVGDGVLQDDRSLVLQNLQKLHSEKVHLHQQALDLRMRAQEVNHQLKQSNAMYDQNMQALTTIQQQETQRELLTCQAAAAAAAAHVSSASAMLPQMPTLGGWTTNGHIMARPLDLSQLPASPMPPHHLVVADAHFGASPAIISTQMPEVVDIKHYPVAAAAAAAAAAASAAATVAPSRSLLHSSSDSSESSASTPSERTPQADFMALAAITKRVEQAAAMADQIGALPSLPQGQNEVPTTTAQDLRLSQELTTLAQATFAQPLPAPLEEPAAAAPSTTAPPMRPIPLPMSQNLLAFPSVSLPAAAAAATNVEKASATPWAGQAASELKTVTDGLAALARQRELMEQRRDELLSKQQSWS